MRIQDIIKKIREALKWLGEGDIAGKINAALEWAFQPFKWLWDKLQSLGLVGSTGSVGDGGGFGPGSGSGGETSLEGRRAGRSGGRSHLLGGGPEGKGGTAANMPAAMAAAEAQLRAEGVPEANVHAAAALLIGQAMAESRLDPTAKHDFNPNTGAFGYGVYGASAVRKGPMFAWMAAHGFARDSLEGQMKYMAHDAMTNYSGTRAALMRATEANIGDSTRIITPDFEGPKVDNSGARIGFACSAFGGKASIAKPPTHRPDLHPPDFHKALESIRAAKPLTPWQQSMNDHHDHRVLNSNVAVNVTGGYPIDKTARPLERTKNAALIRNTTSTAS